MTIEKTLPLLRDEKIFPIWLVPLANDEGGNLFAYSIRNGEEEQFIIILMSLSMEKIQRNILSICRRI